MLFKKLKFKKIAQIGSLVILAGMSSLMAGVNSKSASDTAIYQDLHEIRITEIKSINFDSDIAKLSAREKKHSGKTNQLRIDGPLSRIEKTEYKYSK